MPPTVPSRGVGHAARRLFALAALTACAEPTRVGFDPTADDGEASIRQQIAASWIGTWDGFGTLTDSAGTRDVGALALRVEFDGDSLRRADCPWCVTVILDPWFSAGNLPFAAGASAVARDTLDEVVRSLDIQRFSGAGGTANTLLVTLRHERTSASASETILRGDLQFHRR